MDALAFHLIFLVPISAIVMGVGSGIVKSILESQERRLKMRLKLQQGQGDEVTQQVQALRAEVARLRDTSTQFDLSLDQTVQALERRVGQVEAKSPIYAPPPVTEEQTQRVGVQ